MEQSQASEQANPNPVPAKLTQEQEKVNQAVSLIKINLPFMLEKRMRATAGLSLVKQVTTPEEDQIANNMIVKGKITFNEVEAKRKEITGGLDMVKAALMQPEKDIADQINRIKGMRDKFAQAELEKEKKRKEELETARKKGEEIIRINSEVRKNIVTGLHAAIITMENSIAKHVATMNLENWDEKEKIFNITPKLRVDVYNSFFTIKFDGSLIPVHEFTDIIKAISREKTYDICNAEYQKIAIPTVKAWRDVELPIRKKQLQELADLESKDAAAAAGKASEIKAENEEKEKATLNSLESTFNEQKAEIDSNAASQQLQNDFENQAALQSGGSALPKGTRQKMAAIITASESQIPGLIKNIIEVCFSNPKFPGILKRKKGVPLEPVDGVPVYEDWVKELLDFVANNTDAKIPGLELKPIVSTSARK